MIPTGISPTEAAFEVIGLVNAKSIIDYMFFDTKIGVAAFLIGILATVWQSVKEADFSILWGYLMMFLALTFLFIKPMASLEGASSTMEIAGWKENTTEGSLKDAFIDSGKSTIAPEFAAAEAELLAVWKPIVQRWGQEVLLNKH